MNPTANDPFRFSAIPDQAQQPADVQQPAEVVTSDAPVLAIVEPTLSGEVLPPDVPAPEAGPTTAAYPIGLIDFNQPIVVVDALNDEALDNAQVIAILKGSVYPVVITFWKHGEQSVAQFDTDGDSSCGDYKVEQDQPYPRTVFVVIGRDGRNLVVDGDLYASEEVARDEAGFDEIAGVFPLVIEAPQPKEVSVSDFHGGGVESEEQDDDTDGPTLVGDVPSEMYVAGRNRRVGEIVQAYRNGFGTRSCLIIKMRRDARKSLYIDPQDGNAPYWALNKNVRY